MRKFLPAGADSVVWTVTISLTALVFLLLVLARTTASKHTHAAIALSAAAGIVALVLVIGWRAKPIRYELRDDSVSVVRPWPFAAIIIVRSQITEIRHLNLGRVIPTSLTLPYVFGYAGEFRDAELGDFLFFGTDRREAVVLATSDRKYVITPANPKRFIKHMNELWGRK